MKPLSKKSLEKKYAELGLPREKTDLLHTYFLCFANLYGVVSVREAWDVFRHYEGVGFVRRKDFAAFSGIVQREPGRPYTILELKEVYNAETTVDPLDRLIVNNWLIGHGYGKYALIYGTEDMQRGKTLYMPSGKQAFLSFAEDPFRQTAEWIEMRDFIGNLRTSGKRVGYDGKLSGEIRDLDGIPAAGKRLSDFSFYTQGEQFNVNDAKREAEKERLRVEYRKTARDKILDRVFVQLQTGGYFREQSIADFLSFIVRYLEQDFGVSLTQSQVEQLAERLQVLNNRSHLWLNCGWTPEDLFNKSGRKLPQFISVGPNLRRMFETGERNRAEYEEMLKQFGIKLID